MIIVFKYYQTTIHYLYAYTLLCDCDSAVIMIYDVFECEYSLCPPFIGRVRCLKISSAECANILT